MSRRLATFRSSRTLAIATVVVAIFVDVFVYGIVILILPDILKNRVQVALPDVQFWLSVLLAIYNAAIVICAPIFGYVADRLPNKKALMLGGLLMLALSTAAFAAAPTIHWLVIARLLQGISAAVVWAVGLAVLVEAVGSADMGFAMGWVALAISFGATGGPFIGGTAYEAIGHYGTFGIAGAVIAVDMVLRLLFVQPMSKSKGAVKDPDSSAFGFRRPAPFEATSNSPNPEDDTDEQTGLLSDQHQHQHQPSKSNVPVILQLITRPEMIVSLWCIFVVNIIQVGLEAVLPFHIQTVFGWSIRGVGLLYLTLLVPVLLGPVVGGMYDRLGHFPIATTGMIALIAGSAALSSIHGKETRDAVFFGVSLFIIGIGITLVLTPEMTEVSVFAELKEQESPGCFGPTGATAQCCALITICVAIAGVIGPSALGAIQTLSTWTATCLTCSAVASPGLIMLVISRLRTTRRLSVEV